MNPLNTTPPHGAIPLPSPHHEEHPTCCTYCCPLYARAMRAFAEVGQRTMNSWRDVFAEKHPLLSALSAQRLEKGAILSIQEVAQEVLKFNRQHSYLSLLAGRVACTVECSIPSLHFSSRPFLMGTRSSYSCDGKEITASICYNQQGYLEVVNGPVGPINLLCHQILSRPQVESVQALYRELNEDLPYNNLGELLEFIHVVKEQHTRHPHLSLAEIHQRYQPDLSGLIDKYHGATCILLASKFCQELYKRGIHAQIWASHTTNPLTQLPLPGLSEEQSLYIPWTQLLETIHRVSHANVFLPYVDAETQKECALFFNCSFTSPKEDVENYGPLCAVPGPRACVLSHSEHLHAALPNQVFDAASIAKARLLGRCKATVVQGSRIFGIDFLKNNLYLNSSWTRTELPLNASGRVSIPLTALSHPEEEGDYFTYHSSSGRLVPTTMTHREALKRILKKIATCTSVPDTMEEDLLSLATYAPRLRQEFFLPPIALLHRFYTPLTHVHRSLTVLMEQNASDLASQVAICDEFRPIYSDIIRAIVHNHSRDLEIALSLFEATLQSLSFSPHAVPLATEEGSAFPRSAP